MLYAGIDAGSRTTKVVLLDADSRRIVAAGAVDQGIEQDALAEALLDRLLRENGLGRDRLGRGRGHGLRPQTDPGGRRRHHRNHLPGLGRTRSRARGPDDHRRRRTGQQAVAAARRRHGRRVRDERPLRRRHRPLSGTAGRAARHSPGVPGRTGRPEPHACRDQQHVRGVCRDGDCRPVGLGRDARGHRGRRTGFAGNTRGRDGRPECGASSRADWRRGHGAGHGVRLERRVGAADHDCPAAAVDLRVGGRHTGREDSMGRWHSLR